MAILTLPVTNSQSSVQSILCTAVVGAFLIFVAGFSQPDALHAATHDTRHATGFPCH